jgi:hypothetical protein
MYVNYCRTVGDICKGFEAGKIVVKLEVEHNDRNGE